MFVNGFTSTKNSGSDRSYRALHYLCDIFIGQTIQLAQRNRRTQIVRQVLYGLVNGGFELISCDRRLGRFRVR